MKSISHSPDGIKHLLAWQSSAGRNKSHQRHSPGWMFAARRKTGINVKSSSSHFFISSERNLAFSLPLQNGASRLYHYILWIMGLICSNSTDRKLLARQRLRVIIQKRIKGSDNLERER